jgi:hypothetical protein
MRKARAWRETKRHPRQRGLEIQRAVNRHRDSWLRQSSKTYRSMYNAHLETLTIVVDTFVSGLLIQQSFGKATRDLLVKFALLTDLEFWKSARSCTS